LDTFKKIIEEINNQAEVVYIGTKQSLTGLEKNGHRGFRQWKRVDIVLVKQRVEGGMMQWLTGKERLKLA
jgi:hypothetical protein